MNRPLRLAVAAALLAMQSVAAQAQVWAPLSRISDTIGNETGRVCVGGGADFVGCPSQSLYVTSGGQVGIGTATPSATLDVHGTVSTTYLQLSSPTAVLACTGTAIGAMRYTSGTMQVCDGSEWGNIGIGVPTGTIAAFAASSCPSGWSEYTAARGRFLRGIDNGAGNDPSGTRTPGNVQADDFKSHRHAVFEFGAFGGGGAAQNTYNHNGTLRHTQYEGGDETRPKNVAVTFCVYSGYQSAPGQTILTTLASLTDVSVGGVTTGQVLAFDGASWVPSNSAVASTALGDRITSGTHAVSVNETSGYVSLSTGGTTWGYFSSGLSYVPAIASTRISATNVSGTLIQVGDGNGAACSASTKGAIRYSDTSSTVEYCQGTAWVSMGPSDTVPVSFHVDKNGSNQTITTSTWTNLTWSREQFDTNNNFASNHFTPTVPGMYLFIGSVHCSDAASQCVSGIFKNGSLYTSGNATVSGAVRSLIVAIVPMNGAGDYVELHAYNGGGTTIAGTAHHTYFKGSLLGPQSSGGGGGANALDDLTDVNTSGAAAGSVIRYDGANWVVSTTSIALGDRITSGTVSVTVNTNGFVSLTTGATDWGYLSSGNSYLPMLVANRVSSTNVSATHLQLHSPTTVLACNSGFTGAMRYTSGTMQVCDGSEWGNIGIGVPTGTIAAFAASSCPGGWSEYTAARGRFLRGIDNGAGRDPDGTRAPGNAQDDEFKSHTHNVPDVARQNAENLAGGGGNTRAVGTSRVTDATGGAETRPKNVAVTFCTYSGFGSAITGADGITWDSANQRLGIGTASPGYPLDVAGTARVQGNYYSSGNMYLGRGAVASFIMGSSADTAYLSLQGSDDINTGATIRLFGRNGGSSGRVLFYAAREENDTTPAFNFYKRAGDGSSTGLLDIRTNGDLYVRGSGTNCVIGSGSGSTNCTSDGRLKTDVRPISEALNKVKALRGVYYRWNDKARMQDKTRQHVGVIAQEVQKVLPEAVEKGEDGILGVSLEGIIPVLIEAVKEVKALFDGLSARLVDVADEVDALRTKQAEKLKRLEEENRALRAANDNHAQAIESLRQEMRALRAAR